MPPRLPRHADATTPPEDSCPLDSPLSERPDEDASDGEPVAYSPVAPADIGSASRSCLVILILGAAIVVLVCLSLAVRLVF